VHIRVILEGDEMTYIKWNAIPVLAILYALFGDPKPDVGQALLWMGVGAWLVINVYGFFINPKIYND
jgi:hypothetical protein